MKTTFVKIGLAVGLLLASSAPSKATLINSDYLSLNDGLAVFDTDTGLTWLDISVTQGLGYNQAIIPGYRYATNSEIESLFSRYWGVLPYNAVTGISDVSGADVHEPGFDWFALWGGDEQTTDNAYYTEELVRSYGFYKDEANVLRMAGMRAWNYTDKSAFDLIDAGDSHDRLIVHGDSYYWNAAAFLNTGGSDYGTYLVKIPASTGPGGDSVPEPPVLAFLLIGLLGLGLHRGRKGSVPAGLT